MADSDGGRTICREQVYRYLIEVWWANQLAAQTVESSAQIFADLRQGLLDMPSGTGPMTLEFRERWTKDMTEAADEILSAIAAREELIRMRRDDDGE